MVLRLASSMMQRSAIAKMSELVSNDDDVMPNFATAVESLIEAADAIGSRPAEGSSRKRMPGSSARARAIAARFYAAGKLYGIWAAAEQQIDLIRLSEGKEILFISRPVADLVEGNAHVFQDVIEPRSAPL